VAVGVVPHLDGPEDVLRLLGGVRSLLAAGGLLYTVPSLALFAFLIPFTGLSILTSEIGLVSYTLLILLRNILVGLELPLATPAILAGVRIATVTTIGLVTVTSLIGQGGLGQLILTGLIQDFKTPLVVGTVLSVALALAADLGLAGAERAVTPWSRRAG